MTASRGGRRVLRGVDLEIGPGATALLGPSGSGATALLGPSGSDKSTLLRLLNRLTDPDAGKCLGWQ